MFRWLKYLKRLKETFAENPLWLLTLDFCSFRASPHKPAEIKISGQPETNWLLLNNQLRVIVQSAVIPGVAEKLEFVDNKARNRVGATLSWVF